MAQFNFRCTRTNGVLVDCLRANLADLAEAHAQALSIIRRVTSGASARRNWRSWAVSVSTEGGDEVLVLPFSYALARL